MIQNIYYILQQFKNKCFFKKERFIEAIYNVHCIYATDILHPFKHPGIDWWKLAIFFFLLFWMYETLRPVVIFKCCLISFHFWINNINPKKGGRGPRDSIWPN